MRSSEGLTLRDFQLTPPITRISGVAIKCSLLIRTSELGQSETLDKNDFSVSLDLTRQQFLFPVLRLLKTHETNTAPLSLLVHVSD